MNKPLRFAGLIVAAAALAGCGLFGDKDEELEPMELTRIDESVKVKRVWNTKVGGGTDFLRVALRPAGDGSRIYAASQDGKVSAYTPERGKQIWRTKLDVELSAGPGVGEGRVAVAAKDGFVILLDASSGEEMWRVDIAGESLARPLVKDETVVVQTIDNRVLALSLFDGRERWSIVQSTPTLTMRGSSSPVTVGSTVIAGFDNGRLIAADLGSGTVIWESLLSPPKGRSDLDRLSDIDGELAIVGQDLYVSGYQGRLAAVASESGQVLWSRDISSYAGVAADWNSLYTVRDDGEIIAMTRRDGAEAWRNASLLRREPTVPVPFQTTVVVGDLEGYIHFMSTIDGEMVARERLGSDPIVSAPLVIANRLYVQNEGGSLAAYEIVDDRPRRSAPDIAEEST